MPEKSITIQFGPGLLSSIFIALFVLKLTGTVNISWLWVFAPFWGPFAIAIGFILLLLTVFVLFIGFMFVILAISSILDHYN